MPRIGLICNNDSIKEVIKTALQESALGEICHPVMYDDLQSAQNDDSLTAIVVTGNNTAIPGNGRTEVLLSTDFRFMPCKEITISELETFHDLLERDFGCLSPRIAILGEGDFQELHDEASEKNIVVYGAYKEEEFMERGMYTHFDGIISTSEIKAPSDEWLISYYPGGEELIAVASDKRDIFQAIYNVIDITRNQELFDAARVQPLPKLFHDKRENG